MNNRKLISKQEFEIFSPLAYIMDYNTKKDRWGVFNFILLIVLIIICSMILTFQIIGG
jgi:hypothetical protein